MIETLDSHPIDILDSQNRSRQWSYEEAFGRNRGLVSEQGQSKLRQSRVAVAGLGGVGGLHVATLARLGIGNFTIADPDHFEAANFNRQYGATVDTIGRDKVDVMAEIALAINPEINLRIIRGPVTPDNVDDFLSGADLLVDGIDLYAIDARRNVFRSAAEKGIPAVTAGPMGFSTCWLTFLPNSMTFDRYFDVDDSMTHKQKVVAFLMGLCPRMLPLKYMDRKAANPILGRAPSVSAGCQLAAGVMASEVCKLLTGTGKVYPAPHYRIFDAYLSRLIRGRLIGGNRHPWQRVKRKWLEHDWKKRFPEYGE